MEKEFKIKPLAKQQIIISLDRLTRFKYTEDKYLRVFKDIISSNLIYPKYKKKDLDLMDCDEIKRIVEDIFNFSLKSLGISPSDNLDINKRLLEYEKSIFKFDKNVEKLLKNKIDYKSALALLENENSNAPLNLIWLKFLANDGDQIQNREKSGTKFPLEKIILVEGITEEILLPKFAKLCGCDFDKFGINLISAGGKKQVVRLFYQFAEVLKLPIFVLLDNDAKENFDEIEPKLREYDEIHLIDKGEFEDILSLNLIKRTLNKYFRNYSLTGVVLDDLRKDLPMTQILAELFKERGLEFKKAEFATLISENISNKKDITEEIQVIISEL